MKAPGGAAPQGDKTIVRWLAARRRARGCARMGAAMHCSLATKKNVHSHSQAARGAGGEGADEALPRGVPLECCAVLSHTRGARAQTNWRVHRPQAQGWGVVCRQVW
jgi:hypothetical protein